MCRYRDITFGVRNRGESVGHVQTSVDGRQKDFRPKFAHRYLVDGVVDVKGSWTRQSPLPPTKASLPARSRPPETEALGASFRIVHRQTERTFLASIALPSNRVFLTRALSLVVAIASLAVAARCTGRVATARSTPGVTVVPFRAPLAPKPRVAYPARALSPVVAVGFRGAEGARARPAPNPRHQIPGAGPASVAVLAEGQGRAHAATCVRVADVTWTYARIARLAPVRGESVISGQTRVATRPTHALLAVTLAHGLVAGRVARPDRVAAAGGASGSPRQAPEANRTLIALPACHVRLALALTRHDVAGGAYRANGVASTPFAAIRG